MEPDKIGLCEFAMWYWDRCSGCS